MHTKLHLLVLTGLLVLSPDLLIAQTDVSPVQLNSRVRVTTRSGPGSELVGNLSAWSTDSLELQQRGRSAALIPFSDVARLEISRGTKGHAGTGALIGAGLGALIGGSIKTEEWDEVRLPEEIRRGPPAVARY